MSFESFSTRAHQARAMLGMAPPRAQASPDSGKSSIRRSDITDRLGLPSEASDEQILTAVDDVMARKGQRDRVAVRSQMSAEDAEYFALFPDELPGAPARAIAAASDDEAAYLALFPDEAR